MLAMTQLLTNYVSYIGVRSHSWFIGSCPCAKKTCDQGRGMEGTCYGPPHVGCNEKIGINSLSDELLGSKNEPFKGGGTCRPHFGLSTSLTYPKV